jgi:transposase, IS6 family
MPLSSTNAVGRISAACNDSWRVDETFTKIRKIWMYLYRAVDSQGNTLKFLLSPTRNAEVASHFFLKALHSMAGSAPQARPSQEQVARPTAVTDPNTTRSAPRVINFDKHAAYPWKRRGERFMGIKS